MHVRQALMPMIPFMTRFFKHEWLQLLLVLVPLLAAFSAMPFAVDRVPMQWDMHGHVNWYAPKTWGLLVLPGTLLLVTALVMVLEHFDKQRMHPDDGSLTLHGRATRSIRLGITLMLGAVSIVQIAAALGWHPNVAKLVPLGIALLFAFMGTVFGKLKQNRYVGIRVPWTMNSETVWARTHQAAGRLWTVSGLVVAVASLLVPARVVAPLLVSWIIVILAVPLVVAWRSARDERR